MESTYSIPAKLKRNHPKVWQIAANPEFKPSLDKIKMKE
jgi:hypothetical protein